MQAVERTVAVLRVVAAGGGSGGGGGVGSVGVSEVARGTGLAKSVCSRILAS